MSEEQKANAAYFSGLSFGWASRLQEKDVDIEKLVADMKEEAARLAKWAGCDPLE